MDYFINAQPGFPFTASPALGLFALWVLVVIGAIFWLRAQAPKNQARQAFRQRTATALLVIGGLGIVQLLTRTFLVPVIEWRLWTYLIFFVGLGYAVYAFNYSRTRLAAQVAATKGARPERQSAIASRKAPVPPTPPGTKSEPRPVATTGRRDARRERKRGR
ncbi:MAG TPA: hypothetical protein VGE07_06255 [Herpetosiphonaceae bacterium]